ncbi:hypothetical protein ACFLQ7_01885 [Actinomycetota bacterium]|jgi:hypothetical protein
MKPYRVVLATLLAGLLVTLPACSGDGDVIEEHAWEADLEGSVEWEPAEACSDLNADGVRTITTAEGTMGDLGPVTARWAR